jgi:hypothetical protein
MNNALKYCTLWDTTIGGKPCKINCFLAKKLDPHLLPCFSKEVVKIGLNLDIDILNQLLVS